MNNEELNVAIFQRILKRNPGARMLDDKIFFSDEGYITINLHATKDIAEICLYLPGSVNEINAEADIDGYVLDTIMHYPSTDVDKLFAEMENKGIVT